MSRPFHLIDVFGDSLLYGNPLAVVADADDLDTEEMQALTRWFGFSETAFLVRPTHPGADYRVRIFTLGCEMPFAGHPTLGACCAWLANGGNPKQEGTVVQECGAGLVRLLNGGKEPAFAAPELIRSGAVDPDYITELTSFLSIDSSEIVEARWIDNGPGWVGLKLKSADAVLRLQPNPSHSRRLDLGVFGPQPPGADTQIEVRAFFTDHLLNVREDPVTGSLNAAIAQWLFSSGEFGQNYVASQGARLGRRGRVTLTKDQNGAVWVAGQTRIICEGQFGS